MHATMDQGGQRPRSLFSFALAPLLVVSIAARPPGHPSTTAPQTQPHSGPVSKPSATPPVTPHMADQKRSIMVGGVQRHYLLHQPRRASKTPSPLVFVLHGHGSRAQGMVGITGFDDKADSAGFLVAYLQGLVGSAETVPSWNSGINPEYGNNADDVGFARAVAAELVRAGQVDAKRIYATGLSNGAAMSHRLGVDAADLLAAVAPVAGTVGIRHDGTWSKFPAPQRPLAIVMIHGEQDPNVEYDGGQGAIPPDLFVLPFAESVAFWTKADQCSDRPKPRVSADRNVTTTDYTSCARGSEVMTIVLADGKHEWPKRPGRNGFNATDAIWEFFSRHSK